ncbi:uncharacterized protein LOC142573803 [Dermacentor variabilis]|uniref:uncharacterized protein LOC142573803 n=1 Tax=Dermacentor variabilis TaxID=34621 RepID=UPI003F5CA846
MRQALESVGGNSSRRRRRLAKRRPGEESSWKRCSSVQEFGFKNPVQKRVSRERHQSSTITGCSHSQLDPKAMDRASFPTNLSMTFTICANRAHGCPAVLPMDAVTDHEAACPFRWIAVATN